jgi:hypothetical protein
VVSAEPLCEVTGYAKLDVMRYLVKELGADVNMASSRTGCPPLYIAAQQGHVDAIRCLVKELGADINVKVNECGSTPLMIASTRNHLSVVRCLVKEFGADVNCARHDGRTAVCRAARAGHLNVVRCLVNELSADINKASQTGQTPLYEAAQQGDLDMVRCLVNELGADINQASHEDATPLMIAAICKHAKVVTWLVKADADLKAFGALPSGDTHANAATLSWWAGASSEQTAYLESKTHCANPGCSGTGLFKCTVCKNVRYCGAPCQLAHWMAHKADCKRLSAADCKTAKQVKVSESDVKSYHF